MTLAEWKRKHPDYMPETIDIDADGNGAFFGPLASKYAYKPELRKYIDSLVETAKHCTNRHFVIQGMTVKAAQTKRLAALAYMSPERILVSIELPTGVTCEN